MTSVEIRAPGGSRKNRRNQRPIADDDRDLDFLDFYALLRSGISELAIDSRSGLPQRLQAAFRNPLLPARADLSSLGERIRIAHPEAADATSPSMKKKIRCRAWLQGRLL